MTVFRKCAQCIKEVKRDGFGTVNRVPIGWPGNLCAVHVDLKMDYQRGKRYEKPRAS